MRGAVPGWTEHIRHHRSAAELEPASDAAGKGWSIKAAKRPDGHGDGIAPRTAAEAALPNQRGNVVDVARPPHGLRSAFPSNP